MLGRNHADCKTMGQSAAAVDGTTGLLQPSPVSYRQKHLLVIEGLSPPEIGHLLDLAESYVLLNRSGQTRRDLLRGRTLINLFFEDSTRTRTSFELAGKRLGADVINMSVSTSSVNKGETLLDTAATLNAMN
jgi:aspartate carbamoyltransferase catalytic subunit